MDMPPAVSPRKNSYLGKLGGGEGCLPLGKVVPLVSEGAGWYLTIHRSGAREPQRPPASGPKLEETGLEGGAPSPPGEGEGAEVRASHLAAPAGQAAGAAPSRITYSHRWFLRRRSPEPPLRTNRLDLILAVCRVYFGRRKGERLFHPRAPGRLADFPCGKARSAYCLSCLSAVCAVFIKAEKKKLTMNLTFNLRCQTTWSGRQWSLRPAPRRAVQASRSL